MPGYNISLTSFRRSQLSVCLHTRWKNSHEISTLQLPISKKTANLGDNQSQIQSNLYVISTFFFYYQIFYKDLRR